VRRESRRLRIPALRGRCRRGLARARESESERRRPVPETRAHLPGERGAQEGGGRGGGGERDTGAHAQHAHRGHGATGGARGAVHH